MKSHLFLILFLFLGILSNAQTVEYDKIGIGITPSYPLHIYEESGQGTSIMIDAATNANANIYFLANGQYRTNLRFDDSGTDHFQIMLGSSSMTPVMEFSLDGKVGIGTSNLNEDHLLFVNGSIKANEIKVESGWADFVFHSNYNLRPLKELNTYIQQNGHLPEIPTAKEVEENGISLGEMNAKLLQKIEELTLYTIEQQKQIDKQMEIIEGLEKKIEILAK